MNGMHFPSPGGPSMQHSAAAAAVAAGAPLHLAQSLEYHAAYQAAYQAALMQQQQQLLMSQQGARTSQKEGRGALKTDMPRELVCV